MVKIQVKDVNDNRPTFYPREYNVSLRERETVSTPVVVVVATDKDSGKFGSVRYAIVAGNQENLFRVESSSGEIFLTRPLTRATLAHRLNISATDGAGLRSSHDALVLITVIDSNHQPPIFDSNRYLFSVREDAPRNTVIGTVSASSVTGMQHPPATKFIFSFFYLSSSQVVGLPLSTMDELSLGYFCVKVVLLRTPVSPETDVSNHSVAHNEFLSLSLGRLGCGPFYLMWFFLFIYFFFCLVLAPNCFLLNCH